MTSKFGRRRIGTHLECSDSYLPRDPDPQIDCSYGASLWVEREEQREQGDLLRERLKEMDEHAARLQDMLRCEQAKCTNLQQRSRQQEIELRCREKHINRMKERMLLLTDKHREKGPSIEVLNFPPGGRGKRNETVKPSRSTAKLEEATLRVMLERREAELREAMKLRHSLTTLLHALRVDMEHFLSDAIDVQDEAGTDNSRMDQAEVALGEHVTGGVVQSWRQVKKRVNNVLSEGHNGVGTDQDKLLERLETDLKQSQQLVRLQQQLLQDDFASSVPSELADSYFLEEWERLNLRWGELDLQRQTFERERQSFTDAAIRLSHERYEFEQQKASLLKQQYLCESPLFSKGAQTNRDNSALNLSGLGPNCISGCFPISPSPTKSGTAAVSRLQGGVPTPDTPELYSALNLSYNRRTSEVNHQSETWDGQADRVLSFPQSPNFDLNFDDRW